MGTQADRWEVRDGGWIWLDGQEWVGADSHTCVALAALLDEVRGPVLPGGVKPGYVLEPGTVLPDGWQPRGPFFISRGPYTFPISVEPIPAPATKLVPLHELIGRTLPGEARPVSEFSVHQRPDVVGWKIRTYCGHIVNVDTDTDGMVEVQVES